ncbi:multidrug efflux protein [Vibrio sp. 10N.286.49.C2]|uniref:MATE family efflux transporter n=1 Tax=unclassified Vibrio TaxID=2614977 RepID=UPI000C8630D4|nr:MULTISPECIES: MATE family efflux transporter [unclassified Vibrio]PMH29571.1 multidrug efflux protein [Vibrio sp. 10N.286.49.C2]PMH56086.1 multidrug efflux protein [Vibrio sp. 10N.286.49.B1]PMH77653.1 multidrug efflux protein [Vibrio sp. 10N.286.48.B7]
MQQSIYRQFWRYAIPTIAAMLVNGLYQVVDGIFIGQYMGSEGLAGINVVWPVISVILGIGMMIGVGTGALSSIKQGEGNLEAAKKTLATGLMLLLALGPIVALALWGFSDNALQLQGAQGRMLELATQYLDVLIVGSVFALGSIAVPFLLRNDDSPNAATLLMVIGAVINIVLDYVFIVLFAWELAGAALATAIAQAVVTILGVAYFFSKQAKMRLTFSDFRFQFDVVPPILSIGLASFFMFAYGSFMIALHNKLFADYGSVVLVGAYAILGYIVSFYYLVVEGIANAMQPLLSYNFGAGRKDNMRKLFKVAMISAVAGGAVFVGLLNVYPVDVVSIFNSTDTMLIDNTVTGIRLHLFSMFLDGFLVVAAAYYQSINMSKKALFVTLGNMLVQLPFLYVLPKIWGVTGIWIAYPISNIALTIVVVYMMWKDVRLLKEDSGVPAVAV